MTDGELLAALLGAVVGVALNWVALGVAVWAYDVRRAVREGTVLDGEAIERAKRRE